MSEPGEWQEEVNQWGGVRRFRMVGNVKEYELEVNGIPQSRLEEHNKREAERTKARNERDKQRAAQWRICPLKVGNMKTACDREGCAFFGDGCAIPLLIGKPPLRDTEGLRCPISQWKCSKDCAMYDGGCAITGIFTKSGSEEE